MAAPLCRFGDTAANVGTLAVLDSYEVRVAAAVWSRRLSVWIDDSGAGVAVNTDAHIFWID